MKSTQSVTGPGGASGAGGSASRRQQASSRGADVGVGVDVGVVGTTSAGGGAGEQLVRATARSGTTASDRSCRRSVTEPPARGRGAVREMGAGRSCRPGCRL